jgi:hypothetical protein
MCAKELGAPRTMLKGNLVTTDAGGRYRSREILAKCQCHRAPNILDIFSLYVQLYTRLEYNGHERDAKAHAVGDHY